MAGILAHARRPIRPASEAERPTPERTADGDRREDGPMG